MAWEITGVKIYKPVLNNYLNSPKGDVGQYLRKRGALVMAAAKRQVGVDSGALRESIRMLHYRDGVGQYLLIGSDNKIALMHHNGTRPHVIAPRNHQHLRFSSGGRVIYSRAVLHPGTRPNRYLSDNLILVRT